MAKTNTAEKAVRDYIMALRDPASLADPDRVTELEQKIEQTSDVIEQMRLRAELNQAQNPDTSAFEQAFVEHAKAWADENGIPADVLRSEGVPAKVLREAGFSIRGGGGGNRSGGTRVSTDEIAQHIPTDSGAEFRLKEITEASGASTASVRKVVNEMLAQGTVEDTGPDPNHEGPGRAPKVYRVV